MLQNGFLNIGLVDRASHIDKRHRNRALGVLLVEGPPKKGGICS